MADTEVTFDSKKLDEMLAEVGKELIGMAKAEAAQALAKSAKDDAPAEESEGSSAPAKPEHEETPDESASAGPPPDAASPPPAAAPPGPDASASPDASAAPPADPAAGGAPGAEAPPSMEQLQQAYAELAQRDPEQLKMHFLACKAALAQVMGAGAGAPPAAPEASAPASPPPAASPSPPPGPAPMAMAEASAHKVSASPGNGGKMGKTEQQEIEELKEKLQKQEESLNGLVNILSQPMRKSVKGVSDVPYIARTEAPAPPPASAKLSQKEIQAKLREKIASGKLTKNDKELVMSYNVGTVKVDKIEHLLKDAQ